MIINGTLIIVVAGGWSEESVEILINPKANKIWQFGMYTLSSNYAVSIYSRLVWII